MDLDFQTVKDIVRTSLRTMLRRRWLRSVRLLIVDEVAVSKGIGT